MEQKCLRVSQIDAAKLDNEIYNIVTGVVHDAFKFLPPGYLGRSMEELNLLIKLFVQYYSIFQSNSTFGQTLMSIKYANLTSRKLIGYIILQHLNYFISKINNLKTTEHLGHLFDTLEMFWKVCSFVNFSIFLNTGSKPLLVERLLGLEQIHLPNTMQRTLQSQYLARELLWNGFIELLVFVLPLINYHKTRRIIKNVFSSRDRNNQHFQHTKSFTADMLCAYCHESPVIPFHMGCNHIFCYVCLKGNQMADPGYDCPVCGFSGKSCESVKVRS